MEKDMNAPLSRFGEFMRDSIGYKFYNRSGVPLDKWEVFHLYNSDAYDAITKDKRLKAVINY